MKISWFMLEMKLDCILMKFHMKLFFRVFSDTKNDRARFSIENFMGGFAKSQYKLAKSKQQSWL